MKNLWLLFWTFAKIGCFTFGGGYAMLPMLQKEVVEKNDWATEKEIMDYFAIGQCTPGVIAVNTATFIGYKKRGLLGGIAATLGIISPSIIIITLIATLLSNFSDYPIVQSAFSGIRIIVGSLILKVVVNMYQSSIVDRLCLAIFSISLIMGLFTKLSPIYFVILSALIGIVIQSRKVKK